jgi:crotonobetainyl-CoA:carnitine CoA-transferase CaiB-like acyl-CoA transferase
MVKKNDVLVETFSPGHLEELGIGFDALSELNPGLIQASVTGFGQNGPKRDYKSCDLVASGFGGQMYVTGSTSLPPLKHYGEQSYVAASLFAAVGILLAMRNRRNTGEGRHIDISLQEAVTSTLEHVMIKYFYEQVIPQRDGSLHWNHLFFILPCKDGSIQMSLSQGWETLVEWIADEGMAEDLNDKKWRMEEYRHRHVDHIIEVLERWTRTHTTNELFELGQLMRLPLAPVHSPGKVLGSPQLKERGFFIPIEHSEWNTLLKYPGLPFQFGSALHTPYKRAPLIGENNAQIYKKELGLSETELRRLSSLKII